ncbi:Cytochrome c oxidase assembly factor CtaG [Rhodospirillales bacterium URHD0017]|nr:Cytochrome c oxidase assembly factor CtaG [Rhodospirillales bacterium URHD0017]
MNAAWAHGVAEPEGSMGWSFEPMVVLSLGLAAWFYLVGSARLRARSATAIPLSERALFWLGLGSAALALISPLHVVGTQVFTAHMIEHEILMVVAAPLLVAARPGAAFTWGLPQAWRRPMALLLHTRAVKAAWAHATELWSATAFHAAMLWLWHAPGLLKPVLASEFVHVLQHASFMLSALFFWTAVLRAAGPHGRAQGSAVIALFLTSLQAGLLGALMTFSRSPWYPFAPDPFPICGLTRLEDQALAGLIMWIPACTVYVVAALIVMARWLMRLEARHA